MSESKDDDAPILQNLNANMKCGVFTNADGTVVFVHDQQLPGEVGWVEFDPQQDDFMFIHENGKSQQSGVKLSKQTKKNLLEASEINVVLIQNKKLISQKTVSFIIHEK